MKLATFNIYWLGNERFSEMSGQLARTADDWALIARVISKLNADVLAFQEIVSLAELREVLDRVTDITSRQYRFLDDDGGLLGTDKSGDQKVVIAYDETRYDLIEASPIFGGTGRLPFAVRVRSKDDGGEVLVVGVHFKSGQPAFADEQSAVKRKLQCQHLADWVAGLKREVNPKLPQPTPGDRVVILGDFNALKELSEHQPQNWQIIVDSLDPLRDGHMASWVWPQPVPQPTDADPSTSYIEQLLIDFVILSPSLHDRVIQGPVIYAYDRDPAITAEGEVELRVSDHRPVWIEIDATS
jgi:endonuclease/exonuclease/phosphatase family metal-dependent hydrolase